MNHVSEWLSAGVSPPLDDYARGLPLADLPDFLAALAKAQALATIRLHTPTVTPVMPEPDRLLTAGRGGAHLRAHSRTTATAA